MAQYTVLLDPSRTAIGVFKNTGDPETGANWVMQDEAGLVEPYRQLTPRIKSLWAVQDGTNLHIAAQQLSGRVSYHVFSTSTDAWTTNDEFVDNPATPIAQYVGTTIAIRSDGDVLIAYSKQGASFNEARYARKESGTWTIDQTLNGGATDRSVGSCVLGASDRIHFYVYSDANHDLLSRPVNSTNGLESDVTVDGSSYGGANAGRTFLQSVYRPIAGDITIGNHNATTVQSSDGPSQATPTFVNTNVGGTDTVEQVGNQSLVTSAVFGENRYTVYVDATDKDIYVAVEEGSGWEASAVKVAGITALAISAGCYDRSGDQLGVMYDDNGAVKFHEESVGGGGGTPNFKTLSETLNGADGLQLQGQKLLGEPAGLADGRTVSVSTSRGESITVLDSLTKQAAKDAFAEAFSVVDALGLSAGRPKLLAEGVSTSDTMVRAAATTRPESPSFADSVTKAVATLLVDGIGFADVLTSVKGLFKLLVETITVTDDLTLAARKDLSPESISTVDTLGPFVGKDAPETVAVADVRTSHVATTLAETTTFADALAAVKVLLKLFVETIAAADSLSVQARKELAEGVTTADDLIARAATLLAESASLADELDNTAGKVLAEVLTTADALAVRRFIAQLLAETIVLTDTLAQRARITLVDTLNSSDGLTRKTARLLADTIVLSDSLTARLVKLKLLVETLVTSDALTRSVAKDLGEGVTVSDALAKLVARLASQGLTLSDALFRRGRKPLGDSITLADVVTRRGRKSLAEVLTLAAAVFEVFIPGSGTPFFKLLSEGATVSDALFLRGRKDLAEGATVSDGLTRSGGKDLVEGLAVSDSLVKVAAKLLLDTLTFAAAVFEVFVPGGGAFFKLLSETLTVGDGLTKRSGKLLAGAVALADALRRAAEKQAPETLALAGTLAKFTGKDTFAETVTVTASLSSRARLIFGDTISLAVVLGRGVGKLAIEGLTLAANLGKRVGKLIRDTLVFVGFLRDQPEIKGATIGVAPTMMASVGAAETFGANLGDVGTFGATTGEE